VRRLLLFVVTGVLLLLVQPTLAQSAGVQIIDPEGILDAQAEAVQQAAQRLANEGAQVIVIVAGSSAGTNTASAEQYLDTVLRRNNLAPGRNQLNPNQIVFYVAPNAKYNAIYYGLRWRRTLDPVFRTVLDEHMSPRFVTGDIAGGLVAGIDAVRTQINPPTSPLVYILGAVLLVTLASLVVVPRLRKRREATATLANVRERMTQARRAAGTAIADLGQRMDAARAKAQYDRLSYAPADVERLQSLQADAEQAFNEAQTAFKTAEEQGRAKAMLKAGDYEVVIAEYERAQEQARYANAILDEAERVRATLDTQNRPSTGPTRRLRDPEA
jgi:hypothetical protein